MRFSRESLESFVLFPSLPLVCVMLHFFRNYLLIPYISYNFMPFGGFRQRAMVDLLSSIGIFTPRVIFGLDSGTDRCGIPVSEMPIGDNRPLLVVFDASVFKTVIIFRAQCVLHSHSWSFSIRRMMARKN